eukprot:SAG11_NODE_1166_length_5621_cov_5.436255_3_plen_277_part_00
MWQNEQSAVYHSVKQQVAIAAPLSHKEVILGVKRNVEARQPASARYAGPAAAPKHAVGSQVAATLHDGSVQLVTVHKIHDLAGHDHLSYTVAVPQDNPDRKPVFVRVHSTDIQPRALRIVSPTDASVVVANRHDVTANISLHFTALHFQLGEQADGEACFDMRWSALRYYKGTPLVYGYTPRMNGTSFPRGESIGASKRRLQLLATNLQFCFFLQSFNDVHRFVLQCSGSAIDRSLGVLCRRWELSTLSHAPMHMPSLQLPVRYLCFIVDGAMNIV